MAEEEVKAQDEVKVVLIRDGRVIKREGGKELSLLSRILRFLLGD